MKFGQTFTEYLHGEQEKFLNKCSHVEYKRLKKVLKSCRACRMLNDNNSGSNEQSKESKESPDLCKCSSCALCNQMFFTELTKEASDIAGCFRSRVSRLLNLHVSSGLYRYLWRMWHCFFDDQQVMIQEGRMLLDYVTMNNIAISKILKKYDKIHGSVEGQNFKIEMRNKHIEILQSPWLIELSAFYLNSSGSEFGTPDNVFNGQISCDLNGKQPVMIISLSDHMKYEFSLICAICLDTVFNPYALGCGHLFCKSCACSAASMPLFLGIKEAHEGAKCPVCRAVGVYKDAMHMMELNLLLKNRRKEYWKERLQAERAETVKQTKEYLGSQSITAIGMWSGTRSSGYV
ncbi:putative E3 ubiquitin-protein ligase BAH1-like 1 isoform X1 [Canna indica]|uniref:RING-type E3 ubiquitin transferase n=1 Tax=Canna indica TaxID=4628 RepID=A0AAQ3QT41_9LILI|nr:putative E3 ubiquitin-protein ligase BAH1-like 1 isoform X1 [Canna indica]